MPKTALIVDDSVTMRNMVTLAMTEMGFEVESAGDGIEAVDKAKAGTFTIIVTDINMPNMDGIELVRHLREMDKYKNIPILVLTTESGDNAKAAGRSAGASGWIVKPFNPNVLKSAVTKLCGE